jgi:hypothetical protein
LVVGLEHSHWEMLQCFDSLSCTTCSSILRSSFSCFNCIMTYTCHHCAWFSIVPPIFMPDHKIVDFWEPQLRVRTHSIIFENQQWSVSYCLFWS